jgi:hypothetical protein
MMNEMSHQRTLDEIDFGVFCLMLSLSLSQNEEASHDHTTSCCFGYWSPTNMKKEIKELNFPGKKLLLERLSYIGFPLRVMTTEFTLITKIGFQFLNGKTRNSLKYHF